MAAPIANNPDMHTRTPKEEQLMAHFPAMLAAISFTDVTRMAVNERGQYRQLPRTINRYNLVPITPTNLRTARTTIPAAHHCQVPKGVFLEYPGHHTRRPYMDTRIGIGLTYDERLVAVGGACLREVELDDTTTELVDIWQLQAVHAAPLTPEKRDYSTGLHAGILWRDTLVESWAVIGRQLSLSHIAIRSSANNPWNCDSYQERFWQGYDAVAERLGFMQQPDGNWLKSLDRG